MEKVVQADRFSGVAIAGAAGPAMEMIKLFQLQLEHYEKVEGGALSLEGKANQLSMMVRGNLPAAMCVDGDIDAAVDIPPQTTRARLRGEFIKRAKERKRDYTVDWVHLKLNDQAQRTVLCKDPFKSRDERVEKLIASL